MISVETNPHVVIKSESAKAMLFTCNLQRKKNWPRDRIFQLKQEQFLYRLTQRCCISLQIK